MSGFVVVIPARYASERLPGKPLRDIAAKPMIQHVYNRGLESDADLVVIATDDQRIFAAAESFGADVCMTSAAHPSGTDRLAEVCEQRAWDEQTVVVNLQGDEPMMPPELINEAAALLQDDAADIGTLASPLQDAGDLQNPNVVKVIRNDLGFALYFSRAAIPYSRGEDTDALAARAALHHHGIYAYRVSTLKRIVAASPSALERCERLEQLRAMSLGLRIKVGVPSLRPGPGIDTLEELQAANRVLG